MFIKISHFRRERALTALEVLVILCILAILAACLLPGSRPPRRSAQIVCITNLKEVGLGWLSWVHDHDAIDLPFRTPVTNRGNFGLTEPSRNSAWWQYAFLSNELVNPRILVCPVDRNVGLSRVIATTWSAAKAQRSLQAEGFKDRAVSYTIGLDSRWAGTPKTSSFENPEQILGTDRNILFDGQDGGCSSAVGEAFFKRVSGKDGQNPPARDGWTNAIHGLRGNVLALDGSVQQTSTNELRAFFDRSDDNGRIHFLVPK